MKNWKIGVRIAAGFAAIIIVTLCLGLFAVNRIGVIQKNATATATVSLPATMALSQVTQRVYHTIALLDRHAVSSDKQEMADLEAQIKVLHDANIADFKTYKSLPSDDQEKAMMAKIETARDDFWKGVADFLPVSRLGTDEGNKQAVDIMLHTIRPAAEAYATAVADLVDYTAKVEHDNMDAVVESGSVASRGVLIGLLLSLIIAIPITLGIVRSITLPLAQTVEALNQVAEGDLTASLDVDSKDEIGAMAQSLNNALGMLNNTLRIVADNAEQTKATARQLAAAAGSISSGAQEQAASLEETSASLEQISAAVKQSTSNAKQASDLASGDKTRSDNSADNISAISAMADITESSAKIADIISTVDEIAFQTNLLAVNAAVEAARAGEEGRGFAVVASEVRSLAQRSAGAAKEIKGLIQDSLRKVQRGSDLVNRVTKLVGEIALTSEEQSAGIDQVNSAMSQMDQVTQSNAAQTEELSSTSEVLSEQAIKLAEAVSVFTLATPSNAKDRKFSQSGMGSTPTPKLEFMQAVKKPVKSFAAAKATGTHGASPRSVGPILGPDSGVAKDASFEEF